MGKSFGTYLGLTYIYFWITYKRGLFGIISIVFANFLSFFIKDISVLEIIKIFCFLCILMIFFIDFKSESVLFRIFHISIYSRLLIKLIIVVPLSLVQGLIIYFFY